jgi:hypothetical protein
LWRKCGKKVIFRRVASLAEHKKKPFIIENQTLSYEQLIFNKFGDKMVYRG